MFEVFERSIADRKLAVEIGKMAPQADGALLSTMGIQWS